MRSMMDIMTSGMKQKGNDTAGRTGNQKRIAIIEDDVHIGDIIEESLRREGYQTCRRTKMQAESRIWFCWT